jgi:methylphosphotriester-DNA--protein-cysteine methyltransferase
VGRHLREQLLEVQAPSARIQVLENLLLARLRRARAGHPAVRVAVSALGASGNGARVAEVASSVGLSHRRFVELFEREVGLAPKLYARLQRFHAVKACLAQLDRPPEWATFALVWGYCDQSHMIRDFVAFSDLTPASYLRGRSGETRFEQMVHAFPNRQRAEGVRFIQYDDPSDT